MSSSSAEPPEPGLLRALSMHESSARAALRNTLRTYSGYTSKEELDEKEKERSEYRQLICKAAFLVFLYFFVGSIMYTQVLEDWTFTEAMNFMMVSLMTVGYGDLIPTNQSSRLFTAWYLIAGITIAAAAVVRISEIFAEVRNERAKAAAEELMQEAGDSLLAKDTLPPGKSTFEMEGQVPPRPWWKQRAWPLLVKMYNFDFETQFEAAAPDWVNRRVHWPLCCGVTQLVAFHLFWACVWKAVEIEDNWTMIDSFYFVTVTGTTVGYGELHPTHTYTHWLNFFFIPFAVLSVTTQASKIGDLLFHKDEDEKKITAADLSLEKLLAMDTDGNGIITEYEFLRFMLEETKMVDKKTLDMLHEQFARVDTDGSGELTADDFRRCAGLSTPTPSEAPASSSVLPPAPPNTTATGKNALVTSPSPIQAENNV